jgi:hypothetical protein
MTEVTQTSNQTKQTGMLANLAFNIIIPTLILTKASSPERLGPVWAIVVALAFPIGFGFWDLYQSKKVNGFSILGIVSVFLTGGISLFELDPKYIAIKEAAIPGIIGIVVLLTHNTRYSIVKMLLLNERMIKLDKLNAVLLENQQHVAFDKRLKLSGYIVSLSFFISSTLNYLLAKYIVTGQPGTTEFSEQLGKMTALSYPVIVIPSMIVLIFAIFYLFSGIKKLTGEDFESFLVDPNSQS